MKARILFSIVVAALALGPLAGAMPSWQPTSLTVAAPADTPSSPLDGSDSMLYLVPLLGAIRIKDTASLGKKFVQRAGAATADYKDGVAAAGADWEAGARAGADNYKQAVIEAANQGRFEKGIAAAGQQKFVTRAVNLGSQRFATGVQSAEAEWVKGTQPYLDALKGLELPAKRPRGQNAGRANAVADRLHQMRVGR